MLLLEGWKNFNSCVSKFLRINPNAAFGFILKNLDTQELKFFHPSNNNTIFELPKRVLDEQDYENLREDLERRDVVEYANTQRPGTKWRVVKIVCMRFDVYKLTDD